MRSSPCGEAERRSCGLWCGRVRPGPPLPPEPYIAHPYTLLQTEDLIGRRQELHVLAQWIAEPEAVGHGRLQVVTAIGRAGKSALAWHWFHEAAP